MTFVAIGALRVKLPFVIKSFALSIFERPFYTGFTVILSCCVSKMFYHAY